jgi:type II secretory ATPase GspE/PulE/Tfp pilus assembly ATPase PilB-like protein
VSSHQRLGEVLLQRELITREQLDEALARHHVGRRRLGEVLISMGAINQEQLSWALSESLHIPFVELSDEVIDLEVARSLPETVLRRHEAVPVLRVNDELTVLLADPTNRHAAIEIEALSGAKVTVALAAREAVLHFLDRAFPESRRLAGRVNGAATGTAHGAANGGPNGQNGAVVDLTGVSQVFALLLGAARDRATELHLEPAPNGVLVRVRVDDRLLDRAWFDRELLAPITFRLRLLAGLKGEPAPRLARIRTRLDGRDTELEFFFFPTLSGEAVTVRLQAVATEAPTLESLGVSEAVHRLLVELAGASPMLEERGGLVVVAGPDVRTRAQVLYALAGAAATAGRRVITVERRVSFVVSGFLQVELPADFGTEAASVLTQPADVIVVEDIGPPALATAALASAEQGTLVLAGLGLGSVRSALAYLATVDLRGPLLALTRGVVDVRRRGCGLTVDTVSLTPALRRDLVERKDPWTSPSS